MQVERVAAGLRLDNVHPGEEGNDEWRPRTPVPFGLLPKWPFRPCNALVDMV